MGLWETKASSFFNSNTFLYRHQVTLGYTKNQCSVPSRKMRALFTNLILLFDSRPSNNYPFPSPQHSPRPTLSHLAITVSPVLCENLEAGLPL